MIFTQYTDTMDYVRDKLVATYGSRVGLLLRYAAANAGTPASETWEPTTKEQIKTLFRAGVEIKILIGTDSLSEGLNLQTCGKLVNYDMPWNFMRVEQRIGRIDRIGGRERVEIANYFYEGTVEEQIYRGIGEDFEWFEDVVGPAQPVLNQIESAIETVAMEEPGEQRDKDLQNQVTAIRAQMRAAAGGAGDDRGARRSDRARAGARARDRPRRPRARADYRRRDRRAVPTTPEIAGAYLLDAPGDFPIAVTFRRSVLEEHSPTVRLLTYGAVELTGLLPDAPKRPGDAFETPAGYVQTLAELEELLDTP